MHYNKNHKNLSKYLGLGFGVFRMIYSTVHKLIEEPVNFAVEGKTIRGTLHLPNGGNEDKRPGIVLLHGFMGNRIGLHRFYVKAARYFCEAGFMVLRFDFSGCGESDGDHADITINHQVAEARAALRVLINHPQVDAQRVILAGLSMGGAVAALTAAQEPGLAGTVLWAPVANLYEDILGVAGAEQFKEVWERGIADFNGFPLGRPFLESLQQHHPLQAVTQYPGPLLVIHGTGDEDVPSSNAALYGLQRQGLDQHTKILLYDDADHTFSGSKWEGDVFNITYSWIKEHTRQ